MQHLCPVVISCRVSVQNNLAIFLSLQTLNQLLLFLEDVLQLPKGGLHLLQRELVLALCRLVLGHPAVELCDSAVQQHPLLHQGVHLLHPLLRDILDFLVSILQSSHFSISICMSGHLLGGGLSSREDLHVAGGSLVECVDLLIESLDLVKV